MLWLSVFVIPRAVGGRGDGAKKCMGRRRDGFRDRPVDDHLLAMQGLGDLNGLLRGNILQIGMAFEGCALLFLTSSGVWRVQSVANALPTSRK